MSCESVSCTFLYCMLPRRDRYSCEKDLVDFCNVNISFLSLTWTPGNTLHFVCVYNMITFKGQFRNTTPKSTINRIGFTWIFHFSDFWCQIFHCARSEFECSNIHIKFCSNLELLNYGSMHATRWFAPCQNQRNQCLWWATCFKILDAHANNFYILQQFPNDFRTKLFLRAKFSILYVLLALSTSTLVETLRSLSVLSAVFPLQLWCQCACDHCHVDK